MESSVVCPAVGAPAFSNRDFGSRLSAESRLWHLLSDVKMMMELRLLHETCGGVTSSYFAFEAFGCMNGPRIVVARWQSDGSTVFGRRMPSLPTFCSECVRSLERFLFQYPTERTHASVTGMLNTQESSVAVR